MTSIACAIDARTIERFEAKVDRSGSPNACHLWTAHRNRQGYGQFQFATRMGMRAHRVAYEMAHGPIPDGLHVLHRCDNPPCVNPAHLFLGTIADNNADRHAKGRYGSGPAAVRCGVRTARGDRHGMRLHPERVPRGERSGAAKITDAQVAEIRARRAAGERVSRLAEEFRLSRRHTSDIIHMRYRV